MCNTGAEQRDFSDIPCHSIIIPILTKGAQTVLRPKKAGIMLEPVVCIFPHSDDEFATADALCSFLYDTLPKAQNGRYLLRKLGFKDRDFKARVVRDSLVLFRKGVIIVGDAVVQEPIRELKPPVHDVTERGIPMVYYHDVVFVPKSIRVYRKALPVRALESWSSRKLHPHFYTILGARRDYEKAFPR